jgi:hypothetical protein
MKILKQGKISLDYPWVLDPISLGVCRSCPFSKNHRQTMVVILALISLMLINVNHVKDNLIFNVWWSYNSARKIGWWAQCNSKTAHINHVFFSGLLFETFSYI